MIELSSLLLIGALAILVASAAAGLAVAFVAAARHPAPSAAMADGPAIGTRPPVSVTGSLASAGLLVAFGLLLVALAGRAVAIGHAPWSNLHEFSVAFAAAVLGVHLLLARHHPMEGLAPLTAILAAGLLGFAVSLDDRVDPLVPALQQPLLLTVHVGSAVLAYAVAGVAFVAALAEIAQRKLGDRMRGLPGSGDLRAIGHRAVLVGFPILTLAIVLGSVWANLAWRSYWSNDPKELAAAATWLVFGAYLHVAGRRDRWGGVAPWLIVVGFVGVLFTYIGAGLFIVGEHGYGQP